MLIEVGADTDLATLDFGATALQIAAQNGHAEVEFFLIGAGLDVDRVLTSATGGTLARNCEAQRFANGAGHWEVVIMRAGGADVDEPQAHIGLDKQGMSKAAPPSLHI